MGVLEDRLLMDGDRQRLRSDGRTTAEVVARLAAGELPGPLVRSGAIAPIDLAAALAWEALGGDGSIGLPLAQGPPPAPNLKRALAPSAWEAVFPGAGPVVPVRWAFMAGVLQIHDFWEASHDAAQRADDLGERAFSAYWHGIAHRREPDPGNAAYWFRRVGRHAVFGLLAAMARPWLEQHGDKALAARLIVAGAWSPFAFTEVRVEAECLGDGPLETLARKLQRLEMWLLFDATCAALSAASASIA